MNMINLAVRFLLELSALFATGFWGWNQSDNWLRFLLTLGIPITLAVIWGVFNVPNDPSRSGKAPIVVPGYFRLLIELAIFSFTTWTLFNLGLSKTAFIFGLIVVTHYLTSYDRIRWLLST